MGQIWLAVGGWRRAPVSRDEGGLGLGGEWAVEQEGFEQRPTRRGQQLPLELLECQAGLRLIKDVAGGGGSS